MIELFTNIPDNIKKQNELVINFIFNTLDPDSGLKFIQNYISSCQNEEEKDFIRFYFNMRLEQFLNKGDSNE